MFKKIDRFSLNIGESQIYVVINLLILLRFKKIYNVEGPKQQ